MNSRRDASDWRYERKFLICDASAQQVACWVRQHPARFVRSFPERFVNNLYLDSPGRRSFHDSVDGIGERAKLRVRWYGSLFGAAPEAQLEIKAKRGLLGSKRSFPLRGFEFAPRARAGELIAALRRADLPPEVWERVAGLEPALANRYRRAYYASADGGLRLTLDTQLEFLRAGTGGGLLPRSRRRDVESILELKYAPEQDELARWATSRFPFRLTRSSKYVMGLEELAGHGPPR